LTITAIGDTTFRLSVSGLNVVDLTRERWTLPGLVVTVETDAREFAAIPGTDFIDLSYREATSFALRTDGGNR
ncbi:MAG TPA: hypothetical protein VGA56_09805, partial [Opitutaceae bacterium]